MGTFLLRAVQLLQICKGFSPRIDTQVQRSGSFLSFFKNRGFRVHDSQNGKNPPLSARVDPGVDDRVLESVKYDFNDSHVSEPEFFDLSCETQIQCPYESYNPIHSIIEKGPLYRSMWPDSEQLFTLPMTAPCGYLDQAAGQLLFLGMPFFRFIDASRVWNSPDERIPFPTSPMDKCVMSGGLLNMLDDGSMKQWLRSEHIQFVLRWLVRDQANPLLQQFAVVPMTLSQSLGAFLEEISDSGSPKTTGKHLDKYCRNNHHILSSKFVIMVYRKGKCHWVTQIAVQPYVRIANINGLITSGTEVTGYIYYDPYQPSDRVRHPAMTMPLRFLMNALSLYRDLHLLGALERFRVPDTIESVMKMGCQGPFGIVCHSEDTTVGALFDPGKGDVDKYKYVEERRPLWNWPEILLPKGCVPREPLTNSYDCGVACLLFIHDFIITQCDKRYHSENFQSDDVESMEKLHENEPVNALFQLNDTFELGTAIGFGRSI